VCYSVSFIEIKKKEEQEANAQREREKREKENEDLRYHSNDPFGCVNFIEENKPIWKNNNSSILATD
jgi:hypothetical protein